MDLSIEFACGMFPLWAHSDDGIGRSGCLFLFFGCFAESVSAHALPLVNQVSRWGVVVGLELNLEARPGCVVYSVGALLLE